METKEVTYIKGLLEIRSSLLNRKLFIKKTNENFNAGLTCRTPTPRQPIANRASTAIGFFFYSIQLST